MARDLLFGGWQATSLRRGPPYSDEEVPFPDSDVLSAAQ